MAQIIQIGKRRWLAGMTWSSYEYAPSKVELEEDAERLKASWVSVRRNESSIQGGFCSPIEGLKTPSKLFSLAAMLADSREQPWLGIFKVAEGVWWYIAVRDGHAILPDGDVIGGEQEIRDARDRHSGYTDWNYIEGDLSDLEEFIDEVEAKPTAIRSLGSAAIPLVPALVVILALLIAAGAGYWYLQSKANERARAQAIALERMRAKLAKEAQSPEAVPSAMLSMPLPNDWLAACGKIILDMPLSKYGWALNDPSCDATSATVHWQRLPGATVAHRPKGNLSSDGNKIDQIIPLAHLNLGGKNNAIELAKAKLALRAWAQGPDFTLSFVEVAPPPVLPGAVVDPKVQPAPATSPESRFQLEIPISPFSLNLSSIPGLRLTKLASTSTGWHLEGILYGR